MGNNALVVVLRGFVIALILIVSSALAFWVIAPDSPPARLRAPQTPATNDGALPHTSNDEGRRIEVQPEPVGRILAARDGVYRVLVEVLESRSVPHRPSNNLYIYTARVYESGKAADLQVHELVQVANDSYGAKERFGLSVNGESVVEGKCYELYLADWGRRRWIIYAEEVAVAPDKPKAVAIIPDEWTRFYGSRDHTIARLRAEPPWSFSLSEAGSGVVSTQGDAGGSSPAVVGASVLQIVWSGKKWKPGDVVRLVATSDRALASASHGETALVVVYHMAFANMLVDLRIR